MLGRDYGEKEEEESFELRIKEDLTPTGRVKSSTPAPQTISHEREISAARVHFCALNIMGGGGENQITVINSPRVGPQDF